jgi:hypothetical protein
VHFINLIEEGMRVGFGRRDGSGTSGNCYQGGNEQGSKGGSDQRILPLPSVKDARGDLQQIFQDETQ